LPALSALLTWPSKSTAACTRAHQAVEQRSFSPLEITKLDLGVVAGRISIKSCSKAKNVTVIARTYAASEDLLATMPIEMNTTNGVHRVVILAPSFDFRHCQHSSIEVIIPEGAKLDVVAQAMVGDVKIEADEHALRNVVVATKAALIRAKDTKTDGDLVLSTEVGAIDIKDVIVGGQIQSRVRVGYFGAHSVEAFRLDAVIHFGHSCAGNLNVTSFQITGELAWVNAWNVDAQKAIATVEYGRVFLQPVTPFIGNFSSISPFGFVDVRHGSLVSNVSYSQRDEAKIIGHIVGDETVTPREMSLSSVYGAVDFFVPNPSRKDHKHH